MSFIVFIIFLCSYWSYSAPVPNTQVNSLYYLYNSTNGPSWIWRSDETIWNFSNYPNVNPCEENWDGLNCTCTDVACFVSIINLVAHNLTGTLPSELSDIETLSVLDVTGNNIIGKLPNIFGNFSLLQYIDISDNFISGTIPDSLWTSNLVAINLELNLLTGSLVNSIFTMPMLEFLNLGKNMISGTFPSNFLDCTIEYLIIERNFITGSIPPPSSHNNTLIKYLILGDNYLTGKIPMEVSYLTDLDSLVVSKNRLEGSIPTQLTSLLNMRNFVVSSNYLDGEVPLFLNFSKLEQIDIGSNYLAGMIPNELFDISHLRSFAASNNCFSKKFPQNMCNAEKLEFLFLSGLNAACSNRGFFNDRVRFTQPIDLFPTCVLSMPRIQALYVDGNNMLGLLPELGPDVKFINISLSHNRLEGPIPESFKNYSALEGLDLSYNRLSGTLEHMGGFGATILDTNLSFVKPELYLYINRLSGPIPNDYSSCDLTLKILEGNMFSCMRFPRNNLPVCDPYEKKYTCGSNELFLAAALNISVVLLIVFCSFLGLYEVLGVSNIAATKKFLVQVKMALLGVTTAVCPELSWLSIYLGKFRMFSMHILIIISIMTFIVVGLKLGLPNTRSMVYQYGWLVSIAHMKGYISVIVIAVSWIFCKCYLIFVVVKMERKQIVRSNYSVSSPQVNSIATNYNAQYAIGLMNIVVMLALNCFYVNFNSNASSYGTLAAGFIVSSFKIVWNSLLYAYLHKYGATVRVLLFSCIFSIALAPILSSVLFLEDCCFHAIVPYAPVEYHYTVLINHTIFTSIGSFDVELPMQDIVSFYPPFSYSYACGAQILQNYIPVYLIMYGTIGIILPFLQVVFLLYYNDVTVSTAMPNIVRQKRFVKWKHLKNTLTPDSISYFFWFMVLPLDIEKDKVFLEKSGEEVEFYYIKYLCLNCAFSFGFILSFGIAFPPLAIIMAINIIFNTVLAQVCLERHYVQIIESGDNELLALWRAKVASECHHSYALLFGHNKLFIILCGGLIALFLVDTQIGIESGIVIIVMSILTSVCITVYQYNLWKVTYEYEDNDVVYVNSEVFNRLQDFELRNTSVNDRTLNEK